MFVQYTCAFDDEDLAARATYKWVLAGVDIFVMVLILLFVWVYKTRANRVAG